MKRTTLLGIAAALVLSTALIAAGCSPAPTPGTPGTPGTPTTATPGPTSTPTPTPTVEPSPSATPIDMKVYFSFHEKMQPVARTAPAGTKRVLGASIRSLLEGPTAAERKAGMSSQIPAGTKLLGVTINKKVAVIDLSGEFDSGGGTLSMTNRLAQIVFTATQFSSVDAVTFKIDGKVVKVFGGEGIELPRPQKRSDFEGATPTILVDSPAWGAVYAKGSTLFGTANTFEAVFRLQVRDSAGKLVYDRPVMATSGSGTRGTWTLALPLKGVKTGPAQIRVFEPSAKDGSPQDTVNIAITIK